MTGFFGNFRFADGAWASYDYEEPLPGANEPWLAVTVHDSDVTTVTYQPAGTGSGVAYLGLTPRTYFESPDASPPTDVAREAAGLAAWWAGLTGADTPARRAKEAELAEYLAEDIEPAIDLDEELDVDDMDDAELFVEIKTARFLRALGLPLPAELEPMS
ncbi:hypothetical protein [Symbioplanes lichenis]|uniref:hypothetical protein n=1 Tax=Symbioplanes lichenis TaxID=1629072 RepID=UPI002739F71E|nr:hypothetical protein [Actinoplanes lichenis]